MSDESHGAGHAHQPPSGFIRKYVFSLDHKVIGIQYIVLALAAVLVGMTMSVLMRMNLSWPGTNWPILGTLFPGGVPNGVMSPEFYLSLVTMYGFIAIFCIGSLLGALNFITTLLNMRTRGMSLMRMPLTCWAWFTTAVLALLSFPVLLGGGILLLLDRLAGTSFFIPGGLYVNGLLSGIDNRFPLHTGGSPILWQHLFWFFGHPEVYIAILPGMGATSHILATFARKPVFGYRAMVFAIFAIGLLGFFVWGHHMFISGMSPYSAITFSILTLSIGVPSDVKTLNWLGRLWGGKIRFTPPMLFAIGFVSLFVAGGITGPFLAQPVLDIPLHETFFVI